MYNHTLISRRDLNNQGIEGQIPSALGDLLSLERLYLYRNQLSGTIPSVLGTGGITWLALNDNQLTGVIPSSLGDLDSLTRLYLDDNQLSGEIPASLAGLPLNFGATI
jgi:Leucine-rich repeat (LRR) protein